MTFPCDTQLDEEFPCPRVRRVGTGYTVRRSTMRHFMYEDDWIRRCESENGPVTWLPCNFPYLLTSSFRHPCADKRRASGSFSLFSFLVCESKRNGISTWKRVLKIYSYSGVSNNNALLKHYRWDPLAHNREAVEVNRQPWKKHNFHFSLIFWMFVPHLRSNI